MENALATDPEILDLVKALEGDDENEIASIDALLARYPEDPRLHFMRGSVMAGKSRPNEAHESMQRAVEIAPGYALARYQLGFFELTSGEPEKALSTWGPLLREADDNPLRVFVEGMTHLIRDEFDAAIAKFEKGISLNHENEPMNNDIRLLMGEVRKLAADKVDNSNDDEGHSATSLILGQLGGNRTIN